MHDRPEPLHPEHLTWAALLGRWVEFARQSVGLPRDEVGQLMRDSVPDVIMLQAIWFALQQVDELSPAERALGLDRAEVLFDKHAAAMRRRWAGHVMPEELMQLIEDARQQLAHVRG